MADLLAIDGIPSRFDVLTFDVYILPEVTFEVFTEVHTLRSIPDNTEQDFLLNLEG